MKVVAFERSLQGTGASRRLRRAGKTPGIIYGGEQAPQMIELDHNALYHALKKEQFHSSVLQLEIAGKSSQVLLRDYQMHPFKQLVLHVDFQRVDAGHKISMKVPLHFTGAENSPAVKLSHGLVNHVMNEVEVSCLPAELPEFIAVDLSELVLHQSVHVNDLKLPKGVSVLTHGVDNPAVVTVSPPPGGVGEEGAEGAAAAEGESK